MNINFDVENFTNIYFDMINGPLKGLNLTRITEPVEFYEKQLLDSLYPFLIDSDLENILKKSSLIADVGFGGGFPILPLCLNYSDKAFVGIETRKKKVQAVEKICSQLKLKNVRLFHHRVEEVGFDVSALVLFKAVGPIIKFCNLVNNTVPVYVGFYKSRGLSEQEPGWKKQLAVCGCKLFKEIEYDVGDNERRFIVLEKVPRRTVRNDVRSLVKLMEL